MRLTLTTIEPDERAGLARCLDAASLPSAGIAETGRLLFRFETDSLVGYGGLEGEAAGRLRRLHLSTPPPVPFFRALGHADIDRGAAPRAIAGSREFAAPCRASTAYLMKAL